MLRPGFHEVSNGCNLCAGFSGTWDAAAPKGIYTCRISYMSSPRSVPDPDAEIYFMIYSFVGG
jgi:hypothetical protein